MPRFGLRQIFLCTTLAAVGVALLAFAFSKTTSDVDQVRHMVAYHIGGGFIGAGIATPFAIRAWIGASLGMAFAFVILAALCTKL